MTVVVQFEQFGNAISLSCCCERENNAKSGSDQLPLFEVPRKSEDEEVRKAGKEHTGNNVSFPDPFERVAAPCLVSATIATMVLANTFSNTCK